MYYLDGLKSIPKQKAFWYLVDKSPFLTDTFIRCYINFYNLRCQKLGKKEPLPDLLYESDKGLCFLIEEFPSDIGNYVHFIKTSKNPINKKWKELGFTEVVCSDLFPNQISEFIGLLNNFNLLSTELTNIEISLLVERYYHNLPELYEILHVLSYTKDFSVVSEAKERTTSGLVDLYLDGNFNLFFRSTLSEKVDWNLLIILLIHNLIYLFNVEHRLIKLKSSWLKDKLIKRYLKFDRSFPQVMVYLQNIENKLRQGIISDAKIPLTRLSLFLENKMSL